MKDKSNLDLISDRFSAHLEGYATDTFVLKMRDTQGHLTQYFMSEEDLRWFVKYLMVTKHEIIETGGLVESTDQPIQETTTEPKDESEQN